MEVALSDAELSWKPGARTGSRVAMTFGSGALWRYAQTVGPAYLGAL